ncbi:pseudouridine synthase [Loktanella agnita]|uniref:pseudouridine synthase n=1 Tax=Loktanella agnita TaxID=287097 RepID=UPI0039858F16
MDNNWAEQIARRLTTLETRNAVDQVHRDNVAARLGAIEEALKWVVRLIVGGLLMAALTYAVQGGLTR